MEKISIEASSLCADQKAEIQSRLGARLLFDSSD